MGDYAKVVTGGEASGCEFLYVCVKVKVIGKESYLWEREEVR